MLKQFFKDYFHFSRKDRIGALCVAFLIGLSIFLPSVFSKQQPFPLKEAEVIKAAAANRPQTAEQGENELPDLQYEASGPSVSARRLFVFDPNKATAEQWKQLGLREKTIRTILNYRSKGGRFYKPEDLKKIWGLSPDFYEAVKDYVKIETEQMQRSYPQPQWVKTEFKSTTIELNTADSLSLIALPGIGPKLAARILNFRNRLGGFHSADQVAETYGLPDSTFQKIKLRLQADAGLVKKLNINTATKDELKTHPYIRWNLANAIVEYRNQHGAFKSLEELKNIVLVDEATFKKIVNYLSL